MSDREFSVWKRFLKQEWNRPSRNDWYLMQIASLIETFLMSEYVPPSKKKLTFEFSNGETEAEEPSEEEIKKWADEVSNLRLMQLQAQTSSKSKSKK